MPKRAAREKKANTRAAKLRPEQLLQEAAIQEIEALLSEDVTVDALRNEWRKKSPRPRRQHLRVKVGGGSSPYVVDLTEHEGTQTDGLPLRPARKGITHTMAHFLARRDRHERRERKSIAAPPGMQPVITRALARHGLAVGAAARIAADPLGYFEPYSKDITIIWLLRVAWMLASLPFVIAGKLVYALWRGMHGVDFLERVEIAVRVSMRGFWVAGSVVVYAFGSVMHEVFIESIRNAGRWLRGGLRRPGGTVRRRAQPKPAPQRTASYQRAPVLGWPSIIRRLTAFIAIAAIVVLPLKLLGYFEVANSVRGAVLGESENAVGHLQAALADGQALSFTHAAEDFGSAAQAFADAQSVLTSYATAIQLADGVPLRTAKAPKAVERLLRSGEAASRGAYHLSLAINALELVQPETGIVATTTPLTQRIAAFRSEAALAQEALAEVVREIGELDPEVIKQLPGDKSIALSQAVERMQGAAELLEGGLAEVLAVAEFLQTFLGHEHDARYLLVFQNNAEMRASGGFIGSFALADFRQGALKSLEVPAGGSYDLQGGLHTRVAAPQPLHLINSLWEFQDANWWPDWPTSAEKLEWFFVNGWGSSVDGVIAITPTVIEDMLRVVGPIAMEEDYHTTVSADTFYETMQDRDNLADENEPKAIVRDLAVRMVEELPTRLNWETLVALAGVINENLAEKQMLLYFDNEDLQRFVDERNWSGRTQEAREDYLMVVNTNIAGGKSDRAIRQHITHTADVTPDGSITATVTITRKHTATKLEKFTGVRNVNYLRVYVPEGSTLIEAYGFNEPNKIFFDEPAVGAQPDDQLANEHAAEIDEKSGVQIYEEAGKTVFGHWTQVDPGEEIVIVLQYKLPFKLHGVKDEDFDWETFLRGYGDLDVYSLVWQKQPGDIHTTYETNVRLLGDRQVRWPVPDKDKGQFVNGWNYTGPLATDQYWGMVIEKP